MIILTVGTILHLAFTFTAVHAYTILITTETGETAMTLNFQTERELVSQSLEAARRLTRIASWSGFPRELNYSHTLPSKYQCMPQQDNAQCAQAYFINQGRKLLPKTTLPPTIPTTSRLCASCNSLEEANFALAMFHEHAHACLTYVPLAPNIFDVGDSFGNDRCLIAMRCRSCARIFNRVLPTFKNPKNVVVHEGCQPHEFTPTLACSATDEGDILELNRLADEVWPTSVSSQSQSNENIPRQPFNFHFSWHLGRTVLWKSVLEEYVGKPAHALEVGAHEGLASVWLLLHVLTHTQATLTCVDIWDEEKNPDAIRSEFSRGTYICIYSILTPSWIFMLNTEYM